MFSDGLVGNICNTWNSHTEQGLAPFLPGVEVQLGTGGRTTPGRLGCKISFVTGQ